MKIEYEGGPQDGRQEVVQDTLKRMDVPVYSDPQPQYDKDGNLLKCPAYGVYVYDKTNRMTREGLTIFELRRLT